MPVHQPSAVSQGKAARSAARARARATRASVHGSVLEGALSAAPVGGAVVKIQIDEALGGSSVTEREEPW